MSKVVSKRSYTVKEKLTLGVVIAVVLGVILWVVVGLPYLNRNFTPPATQYKGIVVSKKDTTHTFSTGIRIGQTTTVNCNRLNLKTEEVEPVKYQRCVSYTAYSQAKPGDKWVDTGVYPNQGRTSNSPDGKLIQK